MELAAKYLANTYKRPKLVFTHGKGATLYDDGGRAYLDFGPDWHTDFTVTIAPADMANFRREQVDPRLYAGKTIRVRGIVQQFHGPEIEIANPEQIEVLP